MMFHHAGWACWVIDQHVNMLGDDLIMDNMKNILVEFPTWWLVSDVPTCWINMFNDFTNDERYTNLMDDVGWCWISKVNLLTSLQYVGFNSGWVETTYWRSFHHGERYANTLDKHVGWCCIMFWFLTDWMCNMLSIHWMISQFIFYVFSGVLKTWWAI